MEVQIRVLGPLEVRVGGGLIELPAGRPRRLLVALALRANTIVAADVLVESLWDGHPPRTAPKALQVHISQLRRVLPHGFVLTRAPGYSLVAADDELDVLAFEREVAAGRDALRGGDARLATALLGAALGRWRAGELVDVPDDLRADVERLLELRGVAQEDWFEARLALGEHADVLAPLPRAIADNPYRERLIGLEMLALYRAGRSADALDAFARARARLDTDLGLEPGPGLRDLQRRILEHDPALRAPDGATSPPPAGQPAPSSVPPAARVRTNLPSLTTPLVGRERELADLVRRLTESAERLVTITGLGGSGKTKLAIACGTELLARFADGVFLVSLAPVADESGVDLALVDALDPPRHPRGPEATLIEYVKSRELLLVIDNFEHVLDAAPVVCHLLDAAPQLRVLVTSQASLRLAAESIVPLEPLTVPERGLDDPERLADVPSVRLFVERAQAVDPSFSLTPGNAAAAGELCCVLEGLPLALELAAARVRMAGVQGVLDALGRGIDALGRGSRDLPARQRGLRAALDFTTSLLDEQAQCLFAGLGAFADAWTIEQAEALFGGELDVWEAMTALLDLTLIRTRGDGRLTMAERVKRHARELLSASGREHELRARHAELMAESAEALDIEQLIDHAATIARTRDATEEIEYALAWSRNAEPQIHRRLIGGIGRIFWFTMRLPAQADEIESLSDLERGHDVVSGNVMLARSMLECLRGDLMQAAAWAERALDCHRRTTGGVPLLATMGLHNHALTMVGDGRGARAAIDESLKLAARSPDPRFARLFEGTLAFAAVAEGNWEEAEERLQAILAHPDRTDFAAVSAPSYLADCAFGRRDGELALERYRESLERSLDVDDIVNSLLQLCGIAASLALLGRDAEAAFLIGAIKIRQSEIGWGEFSGIDQVMRTLNALPDRLGRETYERQLAAGSELSFEQLVRRARSLVPAVG
ncbi:MAG: BTAD domain-containing putative transcriptional regulator [Solirubrobacteraceae bacterium]